MDCQSALAKPITSRCDASSDGDRHFVSPNQFLKLVEIAGRTGHDGFVVQVPLNVRRQAVRGFSPGISSRSSPGLNQFPIFDFRFAILN
jgi:hypothetical protein